MIYYVVRKCGSIGEGTQVVTELTPGLEPVAAFTDLGELRRYLLSQVSKCMTPEYKFGFFRRGK